MHFVALGSRERQIIDAEGHGEGRRIDRLRGQGLGHLRCAERMRYGRLRQACERDDVAGEAFLDRRALQPAEGEHLGDATVLDNRPIAVEHLDRLVRFDRAGGDAAGDDAAEIRIRFQDRAEHAERAVLDLRRSHMPDDQIEQRRHALIGRAGRLGGHPALLRRAVEQRKVELLFGGVERGEQVEDFVGDFVRPGVRPVDLVDDDDGLEADFERLGDDELGLRQRALGRIHQHQGTVDHIEDALDLAAEIGVAGGVDDIDTHILPQNRRGLRQDGDAPFTFQIVGIECAFGDPLILAEGAGLLQQAVDQRGLAVVDMRNNGNVAKLHRGGV